jgi:hypothetical protein
MNPPKRDLNLPFRASIATVLSLQEIFLRVLEVNVSFFEDTFPRLVIHVVDGAWGWGDVKLITYHVVEKGNENETYHVVKLIMLWS